MFYIHVRPYDIPPTIPRTSCHYGYLFVAKAMSGCHLHLLNLVVDLYEVFAMQCYRSSTEHISGDPLGFVFHLHRTRYLSDSEAVS
jgi:hypothetical protein